MKRLLVLLIFLSAISSRAGELGLFELHAVADKPGANTREYPQSKANMVAPENLPLESEVLLDGSALRSARVEHGEGNGAPGIYIELTDAGKERLANVTTKYVHKKLGIVLNGHLVSAPIVNGPILGGSLMISGNFTEAEAAELVARLNNSVAKPTPTP